MPKDVESHRVRPFAGWLAEHRHGGLHDEVGVALNELVEAVQMYRKPGKLVLTITIKPVGQATNVVVSDDVKIDSPRPDRPDSLFFVDDEFNLVRSDPRQMEIPAVREVTKPQDAAKAKEAK